jgi:hypothetical protein
VDEAASIAFCFLSLVVLLYLFLLAATWSDGLWKWWMTASRDGDFPTTGPSMTLTWRMLAVLTIFYSVPPLFFVCSNFAHKFSSCIEK